MGPLADEEVVEVEGSKGAEGGGDDTGVEELETETSSENRKDDDEQEVGVPEEGAPPAKAPAGPPGLPGALGSPRSLVPGALHSPSLLGPGPETSSVARLAASTGLLTGNTWRIT